MGIEPRLERPRRTKALVAISAALALVALAVVLLLPGAPSSHYPERVQVRFWHMWTAEWKGVVERIVDRFNESQDRYEVIPLSVPGTAADSKFLLAVAGGDPPDVMAQWNPVIPKWAESGLLVKLDEMMSPEEWAAFKRTAYPAAQCIGKYKEHLYGVTTGLNAMACYVRLEYLRESGLDPADFPETLEGLLGWAEKLNRFDANGDFTRMGFLPEFFYRYTTGFNGGFYDWEKDAVLLNTPENLAALSFLADYWKKLGYERVVRFRSGLTTGIGNVEWPFITGSYAITVDGQWRVEQIARYAPDLEYATFAVPPPVGGQKDFGWVNGNFMIIPEGAKSPEGAWEFIKFWTGLKAPERAAEFYTWGGWLPLCSAIAEAPIYQDYVREHPQFKTFLDLMPSENIEAMPPVPYQVYLWDRIIQADEVATRGTLTPAQALERLEQEAAREVAQRKRFRYTD